jgi:hypothetical protein
MSGRVAPLCRSANNSLGRSLLLPFVSVTFRGARLAQTWIGNRRKVLAVETKENKHENTDGANLA